MTQYNQSKDNVNGNRTNSDYLSSQSSQNETSLFPDLVLNSKTDFIPSPNPPSILSSRQSRKDSLVPQPPMKFTSFSLGETTNKHYISEVLSDSNAAIKGSSKSKNETSNIPKTFVRKISSSEFDIYLNNMSSLFEQYQNNKSQLAHLIILKEIKQEVINAAIKQDLEPLNNLPQHFYDLDFSLETAKSFNLVCSLIKKDEIVESEISLITSSEIQDLLAQYMDLVETHLVREIGERSDGFFSALSLLKSLEEETISCVEKIKELREYLGEIRQQQAKDNLLVIQLKRRRDNMDLLYETLNIIQKAWDSQPALDFLLENKDPLSALELIDELRTHLTSLPNSSYLQDKDISYSSGNLLHLSTNFKSTSINPETSNESINLNKVDCLENFWSYLNEKQEQAIRLLKDRFISMFRCDLHNFSKEQLNAQVALTYLQEDSHIGLKSIFSSPENRIIDQINPIVISLVVNRQFVATLSLATSSLIENLHDRISNILARLLSYSIDSGRTLPKDLSDWENSDIGRQIKTVSFDVFLEFITIIYYHVLLFFRKMKNTQVHVQNFLKKLNSPSHSENIEYTSIMEKNGLLNSNGSLIEQSEIVREITHMTQTFFDYSQSRSSHFLELRSLTNIQLGLNDFYRLYQLVWHHIRHMELLSERSAAILRSSVITQTHSFFQHFHEEKMKHLALNVSSDTWGSSPVAIEYQYIAGMIQHGMHNEVNHPDFFFSNSSKTPQHKNTPGNLEKAGNKEQLMIEGTEYHVSISGLALLKMLGDYLKCALNLPSVTNDVSTRVILLIEHFNNQVCQAVLGAGAMRTAGLNRISARHISLASQTLGMTLALLPGLRRCLELALGPVKSIFTVQIDRITNDLSEHQGQLHSKLVSILSDRAAVHLGRMQKVDWEADLTSENNDSEEEPVGTYMKDLVNDVQSLHRIMNKYLKQRETQQIVTKVNQGYVVSVERAIKSLSIDSPKAKRRLLRDVQYLITGLSTLPTQVANLHHLEVVVNDITL